ncbi:transcription factor bHLH130-like isoform X2 [Rutidosis leptorrhynchoides]|uniref:transcription factor bHLH130-like isoform X2 n=1 Tax=Rutidosis leptorrhynchoides TaxID=125765 RepID=UPI003A9A3E0F
MYDIDSSSSEAISRDMNSLLYSSTFNNSSDTEFAKIKQLISLDPFAEFENNQNQDQNQLQRYRSTPSSFFSNLLNDVRDNEYADLVIDSSNKPRDFLQYESSNMKQEINESVDQNNSDSSNLNLTRQSSSSSAGFLSSLTVENGMKDVRKGSSSSSKNNHIDFSLGSSSSRFLPQISKNENDQLHESTFNNLKRSRDGALMMAHNVDTGNYTPNIVHHTSSPKISSEIEGVDNFLHFQHESSLVPCKTRAKRGFATHPRSIAERVRRTRISERIKRLHELFPDMDKQTNTADMLDMAVDYIKDLQNELQVQVFKQTITVGLDHVAAENRQICTRLNVTFL